MKPASNIEPFLNNAFGSEITIDSIVADLEFLDDWEDRYAYIIDLGKQLPDFPASEKNDDNLVHGCQSQVWLTHFYDSESQRLYLLIDSDAIIVKGLAAVVLAALNAQSPEQVCHSELEKIFADLDLLRHLSPTRGNGLRAMVEKIKLIASHYSAKS